MLYHVLTIILVASLSGADVSDQDIADVVTSYRNCGVESLRQRMPPPTLNKEFRQSIHGNLPVEFQSQIIKDPQAIELLREVLKPVLVLYGRFDLYDIVIVRSPTPLMMSDSGVVLLVTTGMIENATSDDELLGLAAHEVAHEYFVFYSVESRHLLQTISSKGNEPDLRRKLSEVLGLIELHCDAFAAVTLSALHYDALDFIRALERIDAQYPNIPRDNHPATPVRRRVVEAIATPAPSRQTAAFEQLKTRLAQ